MSEQLHQPDPIITADPQPPIDPLPKKKHPQAVENPKSEQFTGRATVAEAARITAAITARRKDGQTYDIVRLTLEMLDHIEDDVFQTFKTK